MAPTWVQPGRRLEHQQAGGTTAAVVFTDRTDGDLAPGGQGPDPDPATRARWARLHPAPMSWARQVHGSSVCVAEAPALGAGAEADALVTVAFDTPLAVFVADCAPVMLVSDEGPVGAVHAGWRGLLAGVIEAAVDELRARGAARLWAITGPCIGPECYEFGAEDLARITDRLGPLAASRTSAGAPALDLRAAVQVVLERAEVEPVSWAGPEPCTSCAPAQRWSHRARGEPERQAGIVWRQR